MLHFLLKTLRARWFVYVVGITVIAVAGAAITGQRALSESLESSIHDLVHRLGRNMLVLPSGTDVSDFHAFRFNGEVMPDTYPGVIQSSELSPHIGFIQARLYGDLDVNGAQVIVVGEEESRSQGARSPSPDGSAVLGNEAAAMLGLGTGDTIVLAGVPLTVAGVNSRPPDGLGMGVFTSLGTAQRILRKPGAIHAMRMGGCWCRLDIPALGKKVEQLLGGTRTISVAGVLSAQLGTIETVRKYKALAYGFSVLLIAGIIAVLTLFLVRSQEREIGLLLALGAHPRPIVMAFVTKAAMIGAIGGLAGYGLGILLLGRLSSIMGNLAPAASSRGIGTVLLIAVVVSVVSAWLPARKVAALDPAEILRET